jgi:hypothetical protein
MQCNEVEHRCYELSEKCVGREYVTIRLVDDLAHEIFPLFKSVLPPCQSTLVDIVSADYYFARFYD